MGMYEIGVYSERAHLVSHLASLFPAVLSYSDADEPDWPVIYIDSPAGQLSWHIAPEDLRLFKHVPIVDPSNPAALWDGHDTEEKYRRLDSLITFGCIPN